MASWKDDPITPKQLEFITIISRAIPEAFFEGTTKGDASVFIDQWQEQYWQIWKLENELSNGWYWGSKFC